MDFYRLDGVQEVDDLGLDDYLYGRGICVIEWADRAIGALPQEHLNIRLDHLSENERKLTFEPQGQRYTELIRQAKNRWNFQ